MSKPIYIDLPAGQHIKVNPKDIREIGYQFGIGLVFAAMASIAAGLVVVIFLKTFFWHG